MSEWSLPVLLASLHKDIEYQLSIARESLHHPTTKGDASEAVWVQLLQTYLPYRYQTASAHVVDSRGGFSQQIDIVVFDRQYSPPIFHYGGKMIVPVESVYAVFEAKQSLNAKQIQYAQEKAASVRCLHRTNLPVTHAASKEKTTPKEPHEIFAGILTLGSDWRRPFGNPLSKALQTCPQHGKLDFGCVASHGMFAWDEQGNAYESKLCKQAVARFLFELIARLQDFGTVPMLDVRAYAGWLDKK